MILSPLACQGRINFLWAWYSYKQRAAAGIINSRGSVWNLIRLRNKFSRSALDLPGRPVDIAQLTTKEFVQVAN